MPMAIMAVLLVMVADEAQAWKTYGTVPIMTGDAEMSQNGNGEVLFEAGLQG